ncbi:PREDICTED: polycomb group protein EMBRYONIC FLOWER 2 isoform X2 [Ipomoea nil]|uniref:polycomb group protein EMBRYONIC FLOWER 2 isoform X2 n=1 Tax=Ipomoea nil TaxID=35883 RepID=UPI000901825E|nr:PREDICTED: polycomb group protein EMBRYONIC FLOWER 2 isoform X2 [Ipomoea nil]
MPGIPLTPRGTSYSRAADQMCRHDTHGHLSAEEETAAEESLSIYCKPVELYNILQRRAAKNPIFIQRCLRYKLQAKHKKRIQMAISLPATKNDGSQIQSLFPLCILLARQVQIPVASKDPEVYCFKRASIISSCTGVDRVNQAYAKFILPEMNKLSAVEASSLGILFISCAELAKDNMDMSYFPSNAEGRCLFGRLSMETVHLSLEGSPNLSLGERTEMWRNVDLCTRFMKLSYLDKHGYISFQSPQQFGAVDTSLAIGVYVAAEEVGAQERTPYDSYSYNDVPNTSLHHIMRLRTGNVVFNYRYYNNKCQRTEVTEDFTCPFCLVKCASFKGLRYHLSSCHDLFNFEFWVTEDYQAVNVSVKTDAWRSEIIADGVDPKQQTFFLCSRPCRRRKSQSVVQNAKHVHPLVFDSDFPTTVNELQVKNDGIMDCDASSPNATGVSSATGHSYPDPDCMQSLPGSSLAPPAMLQFAKTRKLSVERSDPRNRTLLQKRQFFHSHRAQPMAMEQVLSDRDSEDEVDDDVADLEDRRMLDDFVDVTKDEKQMMHLWNSFVRKQRVLADGHIAWACEAFSKMHGQDFCRTPALLWCWRLFMIKLWNHGLLDARTMNSCNVILEQFQNQEADRTRS